MYIVNMMCLINSKLRWWRLPSCVGPLWAARVLHMSLCPLLPLPSTRRFRVLPSCVGPLWAAQVFNMSRCSPHHHHHPSTHPLSGARHLWAPCVPTDSVDVFIALVFVILYYYFSLYLLLGVHPPPTPYSYWQMLRPL